MNRKTLFALGLGLAFTLGLGSCKDNDLTDGSTGGDGGSEQNDALAQKYQTLQNLLGSLASVDSLPDNWNAANYTVAPTVGVLKDDATPHIRYVVTSSQEEADRIYRSYLMKDVTGSPRDDQWQMEGIGSMQFKLENEPNLYATLKVNVQQLPALEEIRFVSEDALGSNGWFEPSGCYYSFGDVICQSITSQNEEGQEVVTPTYWVCVRPCSKSPKRRQSHWCSMQMVPSGEKSKQNYLKINADTYLPTQLATDRGDAERMVQNYFNVLRLMAQPTVALGDSYKGIDDISKDNENNTAATYLELRDQSFMWDYNNLWKGGEKMEFVQPDGSLAELTGSLVNPDFLVLGDVNATLKTVFGSQTELVLNAFYNGYSKNFFSRGDYSVYNMQLTAQKGEPFLQVRKETPYVITTEQPDFRKFVTGSTIATKVHFGTQKAEPRYQLVVKYQSGAELEGKKQSANDVNPAESYEKRQANITDVLVHGAYRGVLAYDGYEEGGEPKNESLLPFFAFGDMVNSTQVDYFLKQQSNRFCIIPAHPYYRDKRVQDVSLLSWMRDALFVSGPSNSTDAVEDVTLQEVEATLMLMAQAAIRSDKLCYNYGEIPFDSSDPFDNALKKLNEEIVSKYVGVRRVQKNDGSEAICQIEVKVAENVYYVLQYIKPMNSLQKGTYKVFKMKTETFPDLEKQILKFYRYTDQFAFRENYSYERTLQATSQSERSELKKKSLVPEMVVNFLTDVKFVEKTSN